MRNSSETQSYDAKMSAAVRRFGAPSIAVWLAIARYGMYAFVPLTLAIMAVEPIRWQALFAPLASSYLTLLVVQMLVARERPPFEKISGYEMWVRTYSFPSGHATESSCLATSLTLGLFAINPLFGVFTGVVLGLLVAVICLARVIVGVHYVGDVLAGCVLGVAVALLFSHIGT